MDNEALLDDLQAVTKFYRIADQVIATCRMLLAINEPDSMRWPATKVLIEIMRGHTKWVNSNLVRECLLDELRHFEDEGMALDDFSGDFIEYAGLADSMELNPEKYGYEQGEV